ncbi:hypothetical protein BDW75DRAFT_238377 [Aspergillus navahoensis]
MSSQDRSQGQGTKPQPLQLSGFRRSSAVEYEMSPLTRRQTLEEATFESQQPPSPGLLTRHSAVMYDHNLLTTGRILEQQSNPSSRGLRRSSAVKYGHNPLTRRQTLEQEPEPSSSGLGRSSAVKCSFNPLARWQTQTQLDDTREYSSSPPDSTMSTSWDTSRSRSYATSTRTRDTSLSPSLGNPADLKLPDTLDGLVVTGKSCAGSGQRAPPPPPPQSVYGKIRHVDDEFD